MSINITVGDVFQSESGFVTVCSMRIVAGSPHLGYAGIIRGKPTKGWLPLDQFIAEMTPHQANASRVPKDARYCSMGATGDEYHMMETRDGMAMTFCNHPVPELNVQFFRTTPERGTPCFRCMQEMDVRRVKGTIR